ncbi:MAG: polymer-forming cytoskeletal protein [Candidatus Magasanikbacteria bacterium]|jgi:cytoskeletal protein CcmA (bactofilin family)|nr:polymer-forming cytoskeletal protein [Candidatus Magasanikbacteria bacterium]MBT4315246.1 polymer-forming cytoskeletal protein [Candidatus Magasanikbacteria bacterium]MBT4547108.1 polymer-forming cytoskeletal protein [Candidatus Magasanikbacteria bacterium]MBT6819605.1 polymer-forming cytoskeletal protein [Candidatus Magasanikbacteria bacterium]
MFQKTTSDNSHQPNQDEKHKTSHDDVETVVGPSVKVEGDFSSEGNIVVKGIVSGSVKTIKLLTVENGAKIFANVIAGDAVISGSIKGNVKVTDRLELTETAQVQGDINCKVFNVAPGALIHGKIIMKGINLKDEGSDKQDKKRISLGRTRSKDGEEKKAGE